MTSSAVSMHPHAARQHISGPLWGLLPMALLIVTATLLSRPQSHGARVSHQPAAISPRDDKSLECLVSRELIWQDAEHSAWELQLSPNERYLAATILPGVNGAYSSRDIRVLIIDLNSHEVLLDVPVFARVFVCFSSLSDTVAIYGPKSFRIEKGIRGAISVYRTGDGKLQGTVDVTEAGWWQTVVAIGISDDSKTVAAESKVNGAWELNTGQRVEFEQRGYQWSRRSISWNRTLYHSGGWPGPGIRIAQLGTGKIVSFCHWDDYPSTSPEFSVDSRMLASTYRDGKFVVWDIRGAKGKPILVKEGFKSCTAFAMSHSLNKLAVARTDGTICIEPLEIPRLK